MMERMTDGRGGVGGVTKMLGLGRSMPVYVVIKGYIINVNVKQYKAQIALM